MADTPQQASTDPVGIIARLLDEAEKAQRKGHLVLAEVCREASDALALALHDAQRIRTENARLRERQARHIEQIMAAHQALGLNWLSFLLPLPEPPHA